MEALETALTEGVWAIVSTMANKYIGQLWGYDHGIPTKDPSYFVEHMSSPITIRWPMEFFSTLVPIQVRTPQGPQMAVQRHVQTAPISKCLDIEKLNIQVTPIDIFFFANMSKRDADFHRDLIRDTMNVCLQQRASDAGILLPGMGPQGR